jgi:uncharacterized membrane protein YcaP (DUF421 family)
VIPVGAGARGANATARCSPTCIVTLSSNRPGIARVWWRCDPGGAVESIFGVTEHTLWYQDCARAVLIFFYGLALVRIAGRRVFGKWSALDIILSIIIGSILSRAVTGNADLGGALAASAVLVALHRIIAFLVSRSPRLSFLVEGSPVELARQGECLPGRLHRHSVSDSDLQEALRQSGVEDIAKTRRVTLEPSGKITVLKG